MATSRHSIESGSPPAVVRRQDGGGDRPSADEFAAGLVQDHAPPLRRYVSGLLRNNPDRIDDVVQETLLRAWQARETLIDYPSARPWLYRVARNLSVDLYRRQVARPVEVDVELAEQVEDPTPDELENVLLRSILIEMLEEISEHHREILLYLYYVGLTQAEVAALLGIAQGTVKSRAHYALVELRAVLRDREVLLTG